MSTKIDRKEAINKATEYLKSVYENAENILLEEIELNNDEREVWKITLSFDNPLPQTPFEIAIGKQRLYRIFEVFSNDGEFKSMKIRKL